MRTVTPIVSYMTSDDPEVHRTTAMALEKLSMDPQNCITMHQVNIRLYFTVNQLVLDNNTKDKSLTVLNVRCVENVEDLVVVVLSLDIFEVKHVILKIFRVVLCLSSWNALDPPTKNYSWLLLAAFATFENLLYEPKNTYLRSMMTEASEKNVKDFVL